MKLKSKSLISIILAIMMVVSMVMFAVPANAATADDSVSAVGSAPYYLWYGHNNNEQPSTWTKVQMTQEGAVYTATISDIAQWERVNFLVNSNSTAAKNNQCWDSQSDISVDYSAVNSLKNDASGKYAYYHDGMYAFYSFQPNIAMSLKITFDGSKGVTLTEAGSTDEPTTTQPTTTPSTDTNYYIVGRLKTANGDTGDWIDSTNIQFTKDSNNLFKFETGSTLAELSTGYANPWFAIKSVTSSSSNYYYGSEGDFSFTDSNTSATLTEVGSSFNSIGDHCMKFDMSTSTNTNPVTLWLNVEDANAPILYYTVEGSDPPDEPATLSAGTTVYVRSKTEITSAKLTSTLDGNAQETEVAMVAAGEDTGETYFSGDVNGYYYYAYTLLSKADSLTFDMEFDDEDNPTGSYTTSCVEGKQVYDVDSQSWSVYEIDKANAYSSGLWVDVQPNVKNSTLALIKWTNKSGASGTSSTYSLYLPSGVELSTLPIYSKFNTLKINGATVSNGSPYSSLNANEKGVTYTVTGDNTTYTLKVYQSTSPSIYTYTPKDLPTNAPGNVIAKPTVKNGAFMTVDEDGAINDTLMTLAQIKGRGNSSWEASGKLFGKYAYNIKLSSKIEPLDMGGTKAKSFCLLANNMDEAQLRNMVTFQMGEDAKIPFTPNFKCVDWYNNGEYLGTYLITEKVDVGSSKLVEGKTVEDYHSYDEDTANKVEATYSNRYGSASYQYVETGDGNTEAGYDLEKLSYLLEFDLKSRATSENSWFQTPKGQYIAVKSYEDLNQAEMLFIIEKWCEAEAAVYNKDYNKANELMDLDTFAQVYLVQELSKNLDSCATSYYVYYDGTQDSPKWQATPLWDYDWAYGEYTNGGDKPAGPSNAENFSSNLTSTAGWFAKYKYITYEGTYYKDNQNGLQSSNYKYNLQAQLANMTNFWNNNVKGVWNNGFYQSAVGVFGTKNNTDGKIDTFYKDNSASFELNEARYGFIKNDPIESWGSLATNETVEATYTYLKNWGIDRINWMATTGGLGIPEETPTLESVTLTASETTVDVNENFTLTASITPDTVTDVTYKFYENDSVIESSSNTVTINKDTAGTYTYKVTATANDVTVTSETITVTVNAVESNPVLKSVTLKSDKYSVNSGDTFTLTATHTDSEVECTYTFYQASGTTANLETDTVLAEDSASNKHTITVDDTFVVSYYYVVAKDENGDTVTSNVVTVSKGGVKNIRIYFKSASASVYVPSLSVDGATAVVMDRDKMTSDSYGTYFGTTYSGSLKFYWFYKDIEIDTSKTHTLTFSTKGNRVYATSEASNFNTSNEYYFAVDNLMGDTELVDLTNEPEYIRNYHITATHMVRSVNEANNVGFTWIGNKEYAMGTYLADNDLLPNSTVSLINVGNTMLSFNSLKSSSYAPFSIKSATLAQKITADLTDVSDLQYQLLDVNLDGVVDVKDATMMQKALING